VPDRAVYSAGGRERRSAPHGLTALLQLWRSPILPATATFLQSSQTRRQLEGDRMLRDNEPEMPEINTDKVCFVVAKSRELLAEDVGARRDSSNATDDGFSAVLSDAGDRPARLELVEFIEALDEDELDALVALTWIGRGDFERDDWRAAVKSAGERREGNAAKYLLGIPLLPDYLQDALSAFDQSCRGFEEREEPGI
jgi:hypothetical protein